MENVIIQLANKLGFVIVHSDDMGTCVTMAARINTLRSCKSTNEQGEKLLNIDSCGTDIEIEITDNWDEVERQYVASLADDAEHTGDIEVTDFMKAGHEVLFGVDEIIQIVKRDDEEGTVLFLKDIDEVFRVRETMDEILAKIAECEGLE